LLAQPAEHGVGLEAHGLPEHHRRQPALAQVVDVGGATAELPRQLLFIDEQLPRCCGEWCFLST
jgi:hypothetical protein